MKIQQVEDRERAKSWVLIGPPGAGKSTVGGLLARKLNLPFIDTDRVIEEESGKKISEIFIDEGERSFRSYEERVVLNALMTSSGVIALGGGSILNPQVEHELQKPNPQREVIFLDVSISHAAPRVGFNKERPLLMINPRAQWQELMNRRRPIYLSLATKIVETNDLSPEGVVERIMEGVGS